MYMMSINKLGTSIFNKVAWDIGKYTVVSKGTFKKKLQSLFIIKIVQCLAMKQNLVLQFTLQKKLIKKHQLNCVQFSMLDMRPTAPE